MPEVIGGNELVADVYGGNMLVAEALGGNDLTADAVADCIGAYLAAAMTASGDAIITDSGDRLMALVVDGCGG